MAGVTYDTGALIAVDRGEEWMWRIHRRIVSRGITPTIPAGVLAQAWRGGPQAELSRLLAGCRVEEFTEPASRAAGTACAKSKKPDVIDASVVVGALARNDAVYTSDPDDLKAIANALRRKIDVRPV